MTKQIENVNRTISFLLTRPLRDVTSWLAFLIFILVFLLTRPLRDVTSFAFASALALQFLLTRPLRDVTFQNHLLLALTNISTHTPLTGRDKLIRFL